MVIVSGEKVYPEFITVIVVLKLIAVNSAKTIESKINFIMVFLKVIFYLNNLPSKIKPYF